ncbi:decaprenyl-phosphate phosphoribosyltransferase [Streptacidiphilus jiangxiensis]|uniref:Decaprenyl-phosphate phosphoribosyltransferase n=1 Tax=Streptacidiphilus jiangxiensis TaxID=235985 RepID=A0A1H7N9N1_STRJI|nr:decaprenyl-phosphate phosphoribosyltransferase [Streptacidiphilus jiangxiensis]SEL20302.1 decaprenyl-phosphate phosphoribosyltransferase [Streptacidiphilus jiangxiensis]
MSSVPSPVRTGRTGRAGRTAQTARPAPPPAAPPRADPARTARAALRTARPRQWPKNLLVLAAPLAAGTTGRDGRGPVDLVLAVGAFTLAAAAGYCVNDLADLDRDRRHPAKRRRPLASGELTPAQGWHCAVLFALGALALAAAVPGWGFTAVLAGYLGLSVGYSLALKHLPGVELAVLASAFVLRAVGGAVASRIPLSGWFLVVCSLGALLVAAAKRAAEAQLLGAAAARHRPALAHYGPRGLRLLRTLLLTATVAAYLAWASGVGQPGAGPPATRAWHLLSALPLLYALLRFDRLASRRPVTRVEDLLLTDRRLLAAELLWLLAFLTPLL